MNQADGLIFQTEKQLKEFGDKLPADKKEPIEKALAELKEVHKAADLDQIDEKMKTLNDIFQAASQEMYNQQNAQGGAGAEGQPQADPSAGQAKGGKDDEVTDVDFEEVKEEKNLYNLKSQTQEIEFGFFVSGLYHYNPISSPPPLSLRCLRFFGLPSLNGLPNL